MKRLLIGASLAALLCVAPAAAQQDTQQPIIKPPAANSQGGTAGKAQGTKLPDTGGGNAQTQTQMPKGNDAPNQAQGDMPAAGEQDQQNTEAVTKKKKAADTAAQGETTGEQTKKKSQNAETVTDQTKKKQTGETAKAKSGSDEMTTGSTGKAPQVTAEKRKVIHEKIVTRTVTKVDRNDIDFDLSVGVIVPSTIVVNPLPVEVVEIVPQYQGFLYFVLADGSIVIVEPGTMRIVTIIT